MWALTVHWYGHVVKSIRSLQDKRSSMSIGENGGGRHLLSPNHLFWNWALFNFSCTFLVLSSLRNYQDLGEMTLILCFNFYLKVFCPLLIVMACRMFWTDLFANLWQHAELPTRNSKSDALKHSYLGPMPSTGYSFLEVLPCLFYGKHLPWPCATEKTRRDATWLKPKFALLYVFRAEIEIIVWVFLRRSWALSTLLWPLPGFVYSI